jgi:hypothetical protein
MYAKLNEYKLYFLYQETKCLFDCFNCIFINSMSVFISEVFANSPFLISADTTGALEIR